MMDLIIHFDLLLFFRIGVTVCILNMIRFLGNYFDSEYLSSFSQPCCFEYSSCKNHRGTVCIHADNAFLRKGFSPRKTWEAHILRCTVVSLFPIGQS